MLFGIAFAGGKEQNGESLKLGTGCRDALSSSIPHSVVAINTKPNRYNCKRQRSVLKHNGKQ